MRTQVFAECQAALPGWRGLSIDDFEMDDPKGFSSFTMGVRCRGAADPPAVLYRRLAGKENAILDPAAEREVFLLLGDHDIAARCHHYDAGCRIEAFYRGRTLTRTDLFDPTILSGIAGELYRFHQLQPTCLPERSFFELLHDKWGALARRVLEQQRHCFADHEQEMCEALTALYSDETRAKVARFLPEGPLTFCHNDTYHGNVMRLDDGRVKLLDFEFSCLNHLAFDFANLFAETVMRHKLPDYPHFRIVAPDYGDRELRLLISAYLSHADFPSDAARAAELDRLVQQTRDLLPLSDYMYAMASIPLAVEPIQKICFVPYAYQRFNRFLAAHDARFG